MTGARTSLPSTVGRLVRDVTAASPVPVGVGFGVSRPEHVRAIATAGADGVIVASALVDALGPDGTAIESLAALVGDLRAATGRKRPARHDPMTHDAHVAIGEEHGAKKVFVWAMDWPGWCRSGKDDDRAPSTR